MKTKELEITSFIFARTMHAQKSSISQYTVFVPLL